MTRGLCRWSAVLTIVAGILAPAPSDAGPLDPTQFSVQPSPLVLAPGTYTVNTIGPNPTMLVGTTVYIGVVSNGVAVFDFSSVTINAGATLLATGGAGSLPLALLSQTTETIGGTISVAASSAIQGAGASNTGVGGNGIYVPPVVQPNGLSGAGGGGFGGSGGSGGGDNGLAGGAGGKALANLATILQGGSAGGTLQGAGSGAGGGAIELGATQSITISGTINAAGGDAASGGGGSGGGIFIDAPLLSITGTLDVHGGAGAPGNNQGQGTYGSSGGGGGGAILVEFSDFDSNLSHVTLNTKGGAAGTMGPSSATSGSSGQYTEALLVPEPSSLVLLGTSTLGLLGLTATQRLRRRRRRRFGQ